MAIAMGMAMAMAMAETPFKVNKYLLDYLKYDNDNHSLLLDLYFEHEL